MKPSERIKQTGEDWELNGYAAEGRDRAEYMTFHASWREKGRLERVIAFIDQIDERLKKLESKPTKE